MQRSSIKANGFVLDSWAAVESGTAPFRRAIGYHFGELSRTEKDSVIQQRHNQAAGRVICDPYYPLIEEGLDRAQAEAHVLSITGEPISKSFCVMCCFSGVCASRPSHEARLRAFPHLAASALRLEYAAMALNENSSLYSTTSLYRNLTEDDRNQAVLDASEVSLDQAELAVYEVRRVYLARRTPSAGPCTGAAAAPRAGGAGTSAPSPKAGLVPRIALNHAPPAVASHMLNFPDCEHDCADINNYDMRRLPRTDVLFGPPICKESSPAGGNAVERTQLELGEADSYVAPASWERTRATAYDLFCAVEVHWYDAVVWEKVPRFAHWRLFDWWLRGWEELGYVPQVASVNAAHIGRGQESVNPRARQHRDRLIGVRWSARASSPRICRCGRSACARSAGRSSGCSAGATRAGGRSVRSGCSTTSSARTGPAAPWLSHRSPTRCSGLWI